MVELMDVAIGDGQFLVWVIGATLNWMVKVTEGINNRASDHNLRRRCRTCQSAIAAKAAAIQRLTYAAVRLFDRLRALRQPWRACGLCLPVHRGAWPSIFPSRTHLG